MDVGRAASFVLLAFWLISPWLDGAVRCRNCPPEAKPSPICAPKAVLPRVAWQAHISGVPRFLAVIDEKGKVEAMEAAKQYRYKPVMRDGEPVRFSTEIAVAFTLSPETSPQPGCTAAPAAEPQQRP
jgi:hypothetical protein